MSPNINDKSEKPVDGAGTMPKKPPFEPREGSQIKQSIALPDELWHSVLECPCTFPTSIFHTVMLNLIKNPNITSSHLFRADVFYDSETDHSFDPTDESNPYRQGFTQHMRKDLQPITATWPEFRLERTIVRQLVPRNPQLDKPIVQTCHVFEQTRTAGAETEHRVLVLYIPHVLKLEDMPFYHPTVSQLAFLHTWKSASTTFNKTAAPSTTTPDQTKAAAGTLTLLYRLFPNVTLTTKLSRTALKLLQTIHKHGQGQLVGYEKRVHHDQLIPQKRYQDTYTELKAKYGRHLSENWVEVTDPGKHVFEDIGIAAFLIELWRDLYAEPATSDDGAGGSEGAETNGTAGDGASQLPRFPGFVDIGCGNGILTYILLSEGYSGSGFDARQRKTWSIFPDDVQHQLEQRILVPKIFQDAVELAGETSSSTWHSGMFSDSSLPSTDSNSKLQEGPFIISNHADELTAWTPLLAYLNDSSFLAIPCCSHDLSGARFRAPAATARARAEIKEAKGNGRTDHPLAFHSDTRLPQQEKPNASFSPFPSHDDDITDATTGASPPSPRFSTPSPIPPSIPANIASGSLAKSLVQKKLASAYSTLCSYIASLAADEDLHFARVATETLRIPSTRNVAVIGMRMARDAKSEASQMEPTRNNAERGRAEDQGVKVRKVRGLVEREMKRDLAAVASEWIARAEGLQRKPGSGH